MVGGGVVVTDGVGTEKEQLDVSEQIHRTSRLVIISVSQQRTVSKLFIIIYLFIDSYNVQGREQ